MAKKIIKRRLHFMKKLMIKLLVCIILFFISLLFSQTFYFYLPWDDSTSNATDLSYLNHKPAGKYGFVTIVMMAIFMLVGKE
jgi:hypothetical protein